MWCSIGLMMFNSFKAGTHTRVNSRSSRRIVLIVRIVINLVIFSTVITLLENLSRDLGDFYDNYDAS